MIFGYESIAVYLACFWNYGPTFRIFEPTFNTIMCNCRFSLKNQLVAKLVSLLIRLTLKVFINGLTL